MSAGQDFAASGLPEKLVDGAAALFPGVGVTFYCWDPAIRFLTPAAANEPSQADGLSPRRLGIGASGRAALRRRPVIAGDYSVAFAGVTPAARAGVVAAMSVPLLANGNLLGALSVGSDKPAANFSCDELAALIELQSTLLGSGGRSQRRATTARLAELEALCDAHDRAALGLAFSLLGDRRLAEQVVQDVLLSAWRARSVFEPGAGAVRPWLLAMVRQRVTKIHEGKSAQVQPPELGQWSSSLLDLICTRDMSCSEVAEWLGSSLTAVASNLRQGFDQLQKVD